MSGQKYWGQDERVRYYADQVFCVLNEDVNLLDAAWKKKRGLNFGCGTGILTEKLTPLVGEIFAVDASPDMIDVLLKKELTNVSAICADIDDDSVRASAAWVSGFDLIVASSVCNFLPDYERTIQHLSQTLKPGEKFVQWDWLSSDDDDYGMTVKRISNAFGEAGLRAIFFDEVFAVKFDDETMSILMGVASAPKGHSLDCSSYSTS
jgi:SAM-dependent methyltransferase